MAKKRRLFTNPSILVSHYYPYKLIEHIVLCSNKYRNKRMSECPDLKIWNDKLTSKQFTVSSVYHFLAIIYYFEIFRLPAKTDYWSHHELMPMHGVTSRIAQKRFLFLWRHFHLREEIDNEPDFEDE